MPDESGFHADTHARQQMRRRGVSNVQVAWALLNYHTSYPAERLPYVSYRCTVLVALVDGRLLKVYVEDQTDPPLVRTVAWKD